MKVIVTGILIMVLTLSSGLWAKRVPKSSLNFETGKVAKLRCDITQTQRGSWHLRVVAKNSSMHPIFDFLYSVRKHLNAAQKDCSAWISAVNKKKAHSLVDQTAHLKVSDLPESKSSTGK